MSKRALALALLGSTCIAPAFAQASDETELKIDRVIVTATKRETDLQSTALAISAIGGDDIEVRKLSDLESLTAAVPNVSFNRYLGQARLFVRGLGNDTAIPTAEGRVAFHIDGFYISRNSVALGTFYDVERVEVVRGPQGTLYGRNATAGAVNVITRKPGRDVDGFVKAEIGNYDLRSAEFAIGGPITSTLSGRIATQIIERGGYGTNLFTGKDIDDTSQGSARISLLWEPSEAADFLLAVDYHKEDDSNFAAHYNGPPAGESRDPVAMAALYGGVTAQDPRDINSERDPRNERETLGVTLDATFNLSDNWSLKSLTGYRHSNYAWDTDLDGTQASLAPYGQAEKSDQYSQELQLHYDSERLSAVLGAYAFKEDAYGRVYILLQSALAPPSFLTQGYRLAGDVDTTAFALFGEATYDINDKLSLIVGGRYSAEEKSVSDNYQIRRDQPYLSPVNGPYLPGIPILSGPGYPRYDEESWDSFTPKIGATYQATDHLFLFATYSTGFKSGGFSPGVLQPAFNQETVTSYELGQRATLFDDRLTLNTTAFYFDYDDIQVSRVTGTVVVVENASSAKVSGLEIESILRPTERSQIDFTGSWLNTEFGDFFPGPGNDNMKGNRLPSAPEWQGLVGGQLTQPISPNMEVTLRGEVEYRSDVFFTPQNTDRHYEEGRSKVNAFLTLDIADPELRISLWGRNLTDELSWSIFRSGSVAYGAPLNGVIEAPRTFGISVTKIIR